ncbi:uncharacterized protein [Apostichopus japonicus]|uniref:uncharacterized protein n=1 Tax=Stichopus japonicus TaxID=307972 RepID=UPI003AB46DD3
MIMYPTMTAGLITPLEEIPLFNGELEALLGESMCSKEKDPTNQPIDPTVNDTNNAVEMVSDTISSPPSVEGNIECISTSGDSEDGSGKIPSELRLLQQKLSEGLVGCRWKARYPQKLTPEGEVKRKQRRERNREAASRCRDRRRERTYALVQESEKFEDDNQALMKEINALEEQKKQIEELMHIHEQSGECIKDLQEIHIDP